MAARVFDGSCAAERRLPYDGAGRSAMIRTMGAAVGATLVLLFLASVASLLTWAGQ